MFQKGQLIGPYELIERIGRGGFGEVWLAQRQTTLLTTKVAVKLPHDDQIDLEAIKREAVLWEQASGHPNVLPIIEANIYDDQIVIVSEYAPSGSLADLLKQSEKVSIQEAVNITLGILAGLEFLHSRNIIHRDLKPANILLQEKIPRLADFGISRALLATQTSQSVSITGTPAYMAPEAFDGKRNAQTDIWSVGVIFYHLLSGNLPFPQQDITSLIGAIAGRDPAVLPTSVPSKLQFILFTALAKNPGARFESAKVMMAAFEEVGNVQEATNLKEETANIIRDDGETSTVVRKNKDFVTHDSNKIHEPEKKVVLPVVPLGQTKSKGRSEQVGIFFWIFLIGCLACLIAVAGAYFLLHPDFLNSSPNPSSQSSEQPPTRISTRNSSSPITSTNTASNSASTVADPSLTNSALKRAGTSPPNGTTPFNSMSNSTSNTTSNMQGYPTFATNSNRPARPPRGATFLCKDGSYSGAMTSFGACSGHGGIDHPVMYQNPSFSRTNTTTTNTTTTNTAPPRGSTFLCKDWTYSNAKTSLGACSGHGGIQRPIQ